jgi:phosphate transport system substrate-binding protein
VESCAKAGIEYVELPVAYDGLTVVVNPQNTWAAGGMTVAELKKLWSPEAQGTVKTWADVRAGWPAEEIRLFGAGVDSGTYDYFTQAIVGKEHSSRGDYTSSEDDNVLVKGVSTDKLALGFFGYAYYESQQGQAPGRARRRREGRRTGPAPSRRRRRPSPTPPISRCRARSSSTCPRKAVAAPRGRGVRGLLPRSRAGARLRGRLRRAAREGVGALVKKRWADRKTGSIFGGHGSQVAVTLESLLLLRRARRRPCQCGGAAPCQRGGSQP